MRSGAGRLYIDMVSCGCLLAAVSGRWLEIWRGSRRRSRAARRTSRHVTKSWGGPHGVAGSASASRYRITSCRRQQAQSLFADIVARSAGESTAAGAIPSGELDSVGARQHGHRVIVGGRNS